MFIMGIYGYGIYNEMSWNNGGSIEGYEGHSNGVMGCHGMS